MHAHTQNFLKILIFLNTSGAGEMTQQFRVLAALAEDLDLAPGTHVVILPPTTPAPGDLLIPYSDLHGYCMHVVNMPTLR